MANDARAKEKKVKSQAFFECQKWTEKKLKERVKDKRLKAKESNKARQADKAV